MVIDIAHIIIGGAVYLVIENIPALIVTEFFIGTAMELVSAMQTMALLYVAG